MALLEATGIAKRFGGVIALDGVDFAVERGEVMALVGDNGAGKSTLIKVLAGAHLPDRGEVRMRGKALELRSPQDAWKAGIATIFQELALAGKMNVQDNIFLGREPCRRVLGIPFLQRRAMRREAERLLASLEVEIRDTRLPVENLSGGQRQGIAIARALHIDADLIIMDEPTAALAVAEVRKVFAFVRSLREQGKAVVLISHNIQDVFEISDRITVLRQGRVEGVCTTTATDPSTIVGLITGAGHASSRRGPEHASLPAQP